MSPVIPRITLGSFDTSDVGGEPQTSRSGQRARQSTLGTGYRVSGRTATWVEARLLCAGGGGGWPPALGGIRERPEVSSQKARSWGALSSASTHLFKSVLPLSLTNPVTPPSCPSAYHSQVNVKDVCSEGCRSRGPLAARLGTPQLCRQGLAGKVPQLTLQSCKAGRVLSPAALRG